jgi:hypothetical protein
MYKSSGLGSTEVLSQSSSSFRMASLHSCFMPSPTRNPSNFGASKDMPYNPHGSSSQKLRLLIPFSASKPTVH